MLLLQNVDILQDAKAAPKKAASTTKKAPAAKASTGKKAAPAKAAKANSSKPRKSATAVGCLLPYESAWDANEMGVQAPAVEDKPVVLGKTKSGRVTKSTAPATAKKAASKSKAPAAKKATTKKSPAKKAATATDA